MSGGLLNTFAHLHARCVTTPVWALGPCRQANDIKDIHPHSLFFALPLKQAMKGILGFSNVHAPASSSRSPRDATCAVLHR